MSQGQSAAVLGRDGVAGRDGLEMPPQRREAGATPRTYSRGPVDPRPGAGLDAIVLEVVLGWEWRELAWPDGTTKQLLWTEKWGNPRGGDDFRPVDDGRVMPWDAPRPSTDQAAACEVEAEVERRALQYPYIVALTAIAAHTKSGREGWENGWRLLRATPAQRCHAALRAIGYGPRR